MDRPESTPAETALSPGDTVRIEAAALEALAVRLDGPLADTFAHVSQLLSTTARSGKKVILTGIGKSGLIARKVAATLLSTGTPAYYLHPAEAIHGDLGILTKDDVLIALSYSGESDEILRLLPALPRIGITLIAITGCTTSSLARASAYVLDVAVDREACNHQLAPTASTTTMLALGDALAIDVSRRLDFQPQDFATLHPGGALGKRLATVAQLMHAVAEIPIVTPTATLPEIIHEISARRLGLTTVQLEGTLLGVISDGDLRRLLDRSGPEAFHHTAAAILHPTPRTIAPTPLAGDALALMEQHKITALVVTEDGTPTTPVVGVLHLHDLLS